MITKIFRLAGNCLLGQLECLAKMVRLHEDLSGQALQVGGNGCVLRQSTENVERFRNSIPSVKQFHAAANQTGVTLPQLNGSKIILEGGRSFSTPIVDVPLAAWNPSGIGPLPGRFSQQACGFF